MEDHAADPAHGRVTVHKHSAGILAGHRRFYTVSLLIPRESCSPITPCGSDDAYFLLRQIVAVGERDERRVLHRRMSHHARCEEEEHGKLFLLPCSCQTTPARRSPGFLPHSTTKCDLIRFVLCRIRNHESQRPSPTINRMDVIGSRSQLANTFRTSLKTPANSTHQSSCFSGNFCGHRNPRRGC